MAECFRALDFNAVIPSSNPTLATTVADVIQSSLVQPVGHPCEQPLISLLPVGIRNAVQLSFKLFVLLR